MRMSYSDLAIKMEVTETWSDEHNKGHYQELRLQQVPLHLHAFFEWRRKRLAIFVAVLHLLGRGFKHEHGTVELIMGRTTSKGALE